MAVTKNWHISVFLQCFIPILQANLLNVIHVAAILAHNSLRQNSSIQLHSSMPGTALKIWDIPVSAGIRLA